MSRKRHGVKYSLKTANSTKSIDRRLKRGYKINPFANGYKDMSFRNLLPKKHPKNTEG